MCVGTLIFFAGGSNFTELVHSSVWIFFGMALRQSKMLKWDVVDVDLTTRFYPKLVNYDALVLNIARIFWRVLIPYFIYFCRVLTVTMKLTVKKTN